MRVKVLAQEVLEFAGFFRDLRGIGDQGFGVLPDVLNAPDTGVTYTPGANINYNGWTAQITGTPTSGDSFTVSSNTGGVGGRH